MEKIIKAKKKFGQNFLKDESYVNKIIESMPHNNRHIVEIGPGLGDLTKKLVKYKEMTAYEIDIDMFNILSTKFSEEISELKLKLVHSDVLDIWEHYGTLHDGKYDLIANLPYYVATNIILRALEDSNCETLVVMIQKEVAQKFVAIDGDKEFSALGVIASTLCVRKELLFDVPPEAFEPPPKVTSSILLLSKRANVSIDEEFKKFLKVCFSQPRKKLSKNLKSVVDTQLQTMIFEELELNENIRPHELSPSLYHQLYEKVIINGRNKK